MNKKLYRTGPYADFFSQGVQVGIDLTLAGQLGDSEDGSVPGDIKDQMINCYNNIKIVLSEFDATLDIRFNPNIGINAYEYLNSANMEEIAKIINNYGEEKNYYQIAKKIHSAARSGKMNTTF